jgi:hypothetical protein
MTSSTFNSDKRGARRRAKKGGVAASESAAAGASVDDGAPAPPLAKRRAPEGPWLVPVVVAFAITLAGTVAGEFAWRALGHRPTVDAEDLDLWSAERRRASSGQTNAIVVIGKSRAQLNIDGAVLKRRYPDHDIMQLALRGRSAWATFEDLATDENFRGKVVFDFLEADLAQDAALLQWPAVKRAKEIGPDALLNARLRAFVASHLVVRSPQLPPDRLLRSLAYGEAPQPNFIVMDRDRFSRADFTRANLDVTRELVLAPERRMRERMGTFETPVYPWIDDVKRINMYVDALRARGGDVAFVKLPVSGEGYENAERFFPKARFFDALATIVRAPVVHFADHPSMRSFTCPDTSHLDEKDAPRFTTALFRELEKMGFLAAGTGSF